MTNVTKQFLTPNTCHLYCRHTWPMTTSINSLRHGKRVKPTCKTPIRNVPDIQQHITFNLFPPMISANHRLVRYILSIVAGMTTTTGINITNDLLKRLIKPLVENI